MHARDPRADVHRRDHSDKGPELNPTDRLRLHWAVPAFEMQRFEHGADMCTSAAPLHLAIQPPLYEHQSDLLNFILIYF